MLRPSIVTPSTSGSFIVLYFLHQEEFCFTPLLTSSLLNPRHIFIYVAAKLSKDEMEIPGKALLGVILVVYTLSLHS